MESGASLSPLPAGEDRPIRASRPPRFPTNRVEAFGAECCPTGSSGDEEGAGETWQGHENEGTCYMHTWISTHQF